MYLQHHLCLMDVCEVPESLKIQQGPAPSVLRPLKISNQACRFAGTLVGNVIYVKLFSTLRCFTGSITLVFHAISTGLSLKEKISLSFSLLHTDLLTEAVVTHGWLPLSGLGGPMLSVVPTRPSRHEYSTFSSCPASTQWCANYSIYFKTPVTYFPHIRKHAHVSQCAQCPPFLCRQLRLMGLVFRFTA